MWISSQSLVRTFCSYRLHVDKCVSPRGRRTNCSVFTSTVNICKEVEHFVLCYFQHPAPAPAQPCCWWRDDETRREPLTVEQRSSRPRMRGGCPENAAGAAPLLGARTRAQSRDTRTRQQRRAGRGPGRYAVPGNRRVSAFRVKHYWVQFSEAARRYVAGSPHRSWAGGDHTVSCTSLQL